MEGQHAVDAGLPVSQLAVGVDEPGEAVRDLPEGAPRYFQPREVAGTFPAQIIGSGPDNDLKSIREMYFAAILRARTRVWIASRVRERLIRS